MGFPLPETAGGVHELSLAIEICRIAEAKLGGSAPQLTRLAVEVGADAGVEPGSLEFCLEALLMEPPFNGARPELIRTGGDVLRLSWLEVDDGRPDD
jgi:Zn finger protein HypA/HybF involved in hydrogenase expression